MDTEITDHQEETSLPLQLLPGNVGMATPPDPPSVGDALSPPEEGGGTSPLQSAPQEGRCNATRPHQVLPGGINAPLPETNHIPAVLVGAEERMVPGTAGRKGGVSLPVGDRNLPSLLLPPHLVIGGEDHSLHHP